jgi:hypothetical protein
MVCYEGEGGILLSFFYGWLVIETVIPLKPENGLNGAPSCCCRWNEGEAGMASPFFILRWRLR